MGTGLVIIIRVLLVASTLAVFYGVNHVRSNKSVDGTEPPIAAAIGCEQPTLTTEKVLNFGSIVGSFTKARSISVDVDGSVSQSTKSYIGASNFQRLAAGQITQPGTASLRADGIQPGGRVAVKLGVGMPEQYYRLENLQIGVSSAIGLTQIKSESDKDKLVFEVTSPNASAQIRFGATLNISGGYHGAISTAIPIRMSWVCS